MAVSIVTIVAAVGWAVEEGSHVISRFHCHSVAVLLYLFKSM